MKKIELTGKAIGKFALVDDEDFEYLNQWKWKFQKKYAVRTVRGEKSKWRTIRMHRLIMKDPVGLEVDHINGDSLDNRKSNLRIASHSQNLKNGKIRSNNKSGYKGVSWDKEKLKWEANIRIDGKRKFIGYFDEVKEAALAYNEASIKYHEQFGRINNL